MSTVAERKVVNFLRKLQSGGLDGNPLSYVKKIYSDTPRKDLKDRSNQLPRIQVKEQGVPESTWSGMGDTTRLWDVQVDCIVYVDMDTTYDYTDATYAAFWDENRNLSPEEACGAMAYHLAKELAENKSTLHSDNDYLFFLKGDANYIPLGIDNEYFDDINVYKGSMSFIFHMRY